MEKWVFWLQFSIIILLLAFILIRDSGVQNFFKSIMGWAKKKIRIAKIKSKINKSLDTKNKLIPELGKNYWDTGIKNSTGSEIVSKLDLLKEEEEHFIKNLKQAENKLKEIKEIREEKTKEKDNIVNTFSNEKKPLEIELKKLEKEFDSIDKSIKEQKKLSSKIENNINANNKEKKKIEADPPGYSTDNEKKTKTKELDDKNINLNDELIIIKAKIDDLRSENPSAKKKVEELNTKISNFNLNINTIKDEIAILKKNWDKEIHKLETEKKQYISELKLKEKNQAKGIKDLGHLLIEKRLDIPQLENVYSQIENIEKTISNLTKKLVKISKSDNLDLDN